MTDDRVKALNRERRNILDERKAILDELHAIEASLRENGEPVDVFEPAYHGFHRRHTEGEANGLVSRTTGFTAVGVDKVRLIFDRFDLDGSGALTLLEFRGYLEALGRMPPNPAAVRAGAATAPDPASVSVPYSAVESAEAFAAWGHDLYQVSGAGLLTFGGFLALRLATERVTPLMADLRRLRLGEHHTGAEEFARARRCFDAFDVSEGRGVVANGELQLLLHASGFTTTREEVGHILARMWAVNAIAAEIRTGYAKRRFYTFEQLSSVDPEDTDAVYREAFCGWWASQRGGAYAMPQGWRLTAMRFAMDARLQVRRLAARGEAFKARLRAAGRGGMLRRKMAACRLELLGADFALAVGEPDVGAEIAVQLAVSSTADKADKTLNGMEYVEPGSDVYAAFDFQLSDGASADEAAGTCDALRTVLAVQFADELERFPFLESFEVAATECREDDTPIVRLIFCFGQRASLQYALGEAAELPAEALLVGQLVKEVAGELRCTLSLGDIFDNRRTRLEEELVLDGELKCQVGGAAIAALVEEAYMAEGEAARMTRREVEGRKAKARAVREEREALRQQGAKVQSKAEREAEAKAAELKAKAAKAAGGTKAPETDGEGGNGDDEDDDDDDEYEVYEPTAADAWRASLLRWARALRTLRGSNFELKARSPLHLLAQNKHVRALLAPHDGAVAAIFGEAGGAFRWAKGLRDRLAAGLERARRHVVETRAAMLGAQLARTSAVASGESELQTQARLMKEKLAKLTATADGLEVRIAPTPAQQLLENEIDLLTAYERARKTLLGLHAITFHADTNRVRLGFEQFDFIELLPEFECDPEAAAAARGSDDD